MDTLDYTPDQFDFPSGNQAPFLMQVFGYFLVLSGLGVMLSSIIAGGIVILIGLRMATTLGGVQIDTLKKQYRTYSAYLYFLKTGKWKSLETYPFLSVLGTNAGFNAMSRGGVENTHLERVWDVYILNDTHRSKLYVKRFDSEQLAWELAEKIVFALEKKTAKYAPVISQASRAKRNRRRRR